MGTRQPVAATSEPIVVAGVRLSHPERRVRIQEKTKRLLTAGAI